MRYDVKNPESICSRCGHRKEEHYKGTGMCERMIRFICSCNRFKKEK